MKLIFVHGRSQQGKDPAKLQKQWETALRKGLKSAGLAWPQGVSVSFPFYGDRLDELIKQTEAPLIEDVKTRGVAPDSVEKEFRGEFLGELAAKFGISTEEIQKHYAGKPKEKGPLNWEWVHSILEALDRTPMGKVAIDTFTRDVYVYLTNGAVRRAVDGIVRNSLAEESCVVVGHSLGSVVGYNVLRTSAADTDIRAYVTVGSPLGLETIKKRITPPSLEMPPRVRSWFNAMDERDVVALKSIKPGIFQY